MPILLIIDLRRTGVTATPESPCPPRKVPRCRLPSVRRPSSRIHPECASVQFLESPVVKIQTADEIGIPIMGRIPARFAIGKLVAVPGSVRLKGCFCRVSHPGATPKRPLREVAKAVRGAEGTKDVYGRPVRRRRAAKPTRARPLYPPANRAYTTARRRGGGTGRHKGLKIPCGFPACGFESRPRH